MSNIRNLLLKTICTNGFQHSFKPGSITLGLLLLFLFSTCNNQPQSATTDIETPVSVQELKLSSIKSVVNTAGTALPTLNADLNSQMSGIYKLQINPRTGRQYKLGDAVKKGDLIIRLEDEEYENNQQLSARKLNLEISEQEKIKQAQLLEMGGATESQIKNTEVTIANARYSLANAEINLEKMNIKAPFDGYIVDLPHYSSDAKVESNQPMVSIMNYSNLYVDINLPESHIATIKPNQPVQITHSSMPSDTIIGVISELSPAISSETRTFKGKILINNSQLKLRPGMYVKADIVVDRADNTVVIPKDVVLTSRNRRYVYVVERNMAVMRTITTGLEDEDNFQVVDGLQENDNLIIRGFETLRNNSRVKVIN